MKNTCHKGFTLLEIIVALLVFSIIATITSSSMYYAFKTRSKINDYADRLTELQIAINIFEQDTEQIINRPIRGNDMRKFPAFIGDHHYLEFTRGGVVNPNAYARRSTLKRVAFLCKDGALVRRVWPVPDSPDRMKFTDRTIIHNLTDCSFDYYDKQNQKLSEWRNATAAQAQSIPPFPTAISLNLTLPDWGNMQLLYLIPGALYVEIQ